MKTALLVIDVQTSLIAEGAWEASAILGRIGVLIASARSAAVPVVFVVDRRVGPDGSIHEALEVRDGDPIVEKSYSDSFLDTGLDDLLRSEGVGRLVVVGLQTDYCVDTTCRRAASLGYEVVLVSDAHTTFDHEHLTAPQIIAHHNRILRDFPAASGRVRVMPSSDVRLGR